MHACENLKHMKLLLPGDKLSNVDETYNESVENSLMIIQHAERYESSSSSSSVSTMPYLPLPTPSSMLHTYLPIICPCVMLCEEICYSEKFPCSLQFHFYFFGWNCAVEFISNRPAMSYCRRLANFNFCFQFQHVFFPLLNPMLKSNFNGRAVSRQIKKH